MIGWLLCWRRHEIIERPAIDERSFPDVGTKMDLWNGIASLFLLLVRPDEEDWMMMSQRINATSLMTLMTTKQNENVRICIWLSWDWG